MVVSASGGKAIIQNPETALYSGMPSSAHHHVPDAQIANLQDIPILLWQQISSPLPAATSRLGSTPLGAAKETRIVELDMKEISSEERLGSPSPFGCPDCGGVLWEIEQEGFSPLSLSSGPRSHRPVSWRGTKAYGRNRALGGATGVGGKCLIIPADGWTGDQVPSPDSSAAVPGACFKYRS